ncbi:MAG: hypothetical protein HW422_1026 [Cutibacterium acnes]|nr:hypothetical protein [Cutibacterium acnes]
MSTSRKECRVRRQLRRHCGPALPRALESPRHPRRRALPHHLGWHNRRCCPTDDDFGPQPEPHRRSVGQRHIQRHLRCSPTRSRSPRRPNRAPHHLRDWRGPLRRRVSAGRDGVGPWLPHRLAYRPGCGRRACVAVHPVISELALPGQGSRRRFRHLGRRHEWHGSPRPTAGRSLD